ncbi:MarR family winged helix-turn-helix transcriptional regulator [Microbacterium sp. NPDC057407]|uniref:MarR family winged helix-turn-helix transcriptional regulator n=1 Tax=Microbacterium sp. NPDC057407 TaxID=3346120 RepID=UPI00366FD29E
MNNDDDLPQNDPDPGPVPGERRPLGYWLRAVDALLTREFAAAFQSEGVTRRDWMILNVLSGDVDAPGAAERLARKGKRLRRLEDLGWVEEQGDGTWALTDEGRAARERLSTAVDSIRARVAGAVSPEDYATTMASLEAIARELGWDEASGFPPGRGPWGRGFGGPRPFRPDLRFGWGPNLHHGFGPGRPGRPGDPRRSTSHGDAWAGEAFDDGCPAPGPHTHHGRFGHGPGWRHGWGGHGHGHGHADAAGWPGYGHGHGHGHGHGRGHGHSHGHGRGHRKAERAYERGFAAGFGAAQAGPADPHAPGTAA